MDEDEVAEVDVGLPGSQCLFADAGEADHGLQLGTVAFLQSREAQLAGVAHEDDAADDTDQHASRRVRLEFRVLRADLRERVGAIDRNRVRLLPPLREDPFTLLAPDTELLGGVSSTGWASTSLTGYKTTGPCPPRLLLVTPRQPRARFPTAGTARPERDST